MTPRIYQVEEGAGGISREALHEKAVAFVEERYPRTGNVPFLWIIDDGEALVWIETGWESEAEKLLSYDAIALALMISEARQYASIVEVWMASQKPAADGSFDHDEPLPSERPENERDDAVMISTFERNGAFSLTTFIAKQQSKLLGARVDHESSGLGLGQWSGRMFNLFSHGRKLAVALVSKERSA